MKRTTITILSLLTLAVVSVVFAYPNADLKPFAGDIIFSHDLHVNGNGIECATCHASVDSSKLASDKNLPPMDVCAGCHEQVQQDTACGMCHHNAIEPSGLDNQHRPILFSHAAHLGRKVACATCHTGIAKSKEPTSADYPTMPVCMTCHDGATAPMKCALCHENKITLADIHPINWRTQHADAANRDKSWCQSCHRNQEFCIACHRGDNTRGTIHPLNFKLNHGLDAKAKLATCLSCHDTKTFCDNCHRDQLRMPLNHSSASWRTRHGDEARQDVEDCQVCHDSGDPTCARAGCHRDTDGVRGTNPDIHGGRNGQMNEHGPWHNDSGYFCFQCHVSTHTPGQGFCGYCHDRD